MSTQFRIADIFLHSLACLSGDEQKASKTTVFDLQANLSSPGLGFHKLSKAQDKHFCSVRVNDDLPLIVHRSDGNLLLCYVDYHDKAYECAERRRTLNELARSYYRDAAREDTMTDLRDLRS
jgi:hypothetical protein